MRYLGSLTCSGVLDLQGEATPARFEFECYLIKAGVLACSGEVLAPSSALRRMQGEHDVPFRTDEGHQLKLTLSDKKNAPSGGSAHVMATGELPVFKNGALLWPTTVDGEAA